MLLKLRNNQFQDCLVLITFILRKSQMLLHRFCVQADNKNTYSELMVIKPVINDHTLKLQLFEHFYNNKHNYQTMFIW